MKLAGRLVIIMLAGALSGMIWQAALTRWRGPTLWAGTDKYPLLEPQEEQQDKKCLEFFNSPRCAPPVVCFCGGDWYAVEPPCPEGQTCTFKGVTPWG